MGGGLGVQGAGCRQTESGRSDGCTDTNTDTDAMRCDASILDRINPSLRWACAHKYRYLDSHDVECGDTGSGTYCVLIQPPTFCSKLTARSG